MRFTFAGVLFIFLLGFAFTGCQERTYLPLAVKKSIPPLVDITQTEELPVITETTPDKSEQVYSPIVIKGAQATSTPVEVNLPLVSGKSSRLQTDGWSLKPSNIAGNKTNGKFYIFLKYPEVIGGESSVMGELSKNIQDWINLEMSNFLQIVETSSPDSENGYLLSTYAVPSSSGWKPEEELIDYSADLETFSDEQAIHDSGHPVVSILFHVTEYAGGAHPTDHHYSINYDLGLGRIINLDELFIPGSDYLEAISSYMKAKLSERPGLLAEVIQTGAAPRAENYRIWNIAPEGLWFTLEEYQVGPYAAGAQYVLVPYSEFFHIISPTGAIGKLVSQEK